MLTENLNEEKTFEQMVQELEEFHKQFLEKRVDQNAYIQDGSVLPAILQEVELLQSKNGKFYLKMQVELVHSGKRLTNLWWLPRDKQATSEQAEDTAARHMERLGYIGDGVVGQNVLVQLGSYTDSSGVIRRNASYVYRDAKDAIGMHIWREQHPSPYQKKEEVF